jgi:hypothetical protein
VYLRNSDRILKAHDGALWRELMPEIRAWRKQVKEAAKGYQIGDWVLIHHPAWRDRLSGQVIHIYRTGYVSVAISPDGRLASKTLCIPATILQKSTPTNNRSVTGTPSNSQKI